MVRKEKWKMKKPEEENVPTQMLQLNQQGQPSPSRPLQEQPLGMGRPWSSCLEGHWCLPSPAAAEQGGCPGRGPAAGHRDKLPR